MNAVYQDDYGGVAAFKYGKLPRPSPGAGEVLLAVHAASANPIDFKRDYFLKGETFPIVGGYDVAGVVAEVGEGDVGSLKVGDRVFGEITGNAITPKHTGSFAEFASVPANFLGKMDESASFEDMAATPVAIGTAIQAIELLELKAGQKIFISAGAGGVGCHAIQIAKRVYGAEVATTASAPKADFCKELGADRVVDYRNQDAGEVLAGWADVVFACTSEIPMFQKIAKEGGKIVTIVDFDSNPGVTPLLVKGSTELMDKITEYVSSGKVKVITDTIYPLSEGVEALKHVEKGRAKGKVVIKVQ